MWKSIKIFLVGFATACLSVLLFIIARGNRDFADVGRTDIDNNNNRIRHSFDKTREFNNRARERNQEARENLRLERESVKRERQRARRERDIINSTRKTVSEIIRNAKNKADKD